MKIFKLPDLGEGLPSADIREWYVKEGDTVKVDQPIAAMETAKALVDVPSPFDGKVEKLFGKVGDTIETGSPLIGFEGEAEANEGRKDAGTVVGAIEESGAILEEKASGLSAQKSSTSRVKATPAVRMLAKQLGVDLDQIKPAQGDTVTAEDVKRAIGGGAAPAKAAAPKPTGMPAAERVSLSQVTRAMVLSMTQSQSVARVTIADDVDLHAWNDKQDMTLRLIRAMKDACQIVPILNSHFHPEEMAYDLYKTINIGIAVDTPHGLYVPVIKDVGNQSDAELRAVIEKFKKHAQDRSFPSADLQGATIMLSNFGSLAGRYANPIIVPPMVAIIGVGRSREEVVPENGKPAIHRILPLSVSVDHRLITGGEAARFLKAMMESLKQTS